MVRIPQPVVYIIGVVLSLLSLQCVEGFWRLPLALNTRRLRNFAVQPLSSTGNVDNESYLLESDFLELSKDSALKQLIVRFDCEVIDPDEISELLHEMGTSSVSVEVESERSEVLNDEKQWGDLIKTRSWAFALLRATVPATFDSDTLALILRDTYPDTVLDIRIETLDNRDWVSHVQQVWHPQEIGKITVCLPWHDIAALNAASPEQDFIVLEGGAAFGTGDHPTTRLCCKWLQDVLPAFPDEKRRVLDYGCGSAILALTGLKFGATRADGVDIDRDSLISAHHNAQRNQLAVQLYLADETDSSADSDGQTSSILMNQLRGAGSREDFASVKVIEEEQYEVVVANILAPILIQLAARLAAHTRPGGRIALSGVIARQAEKVVAAYRPYFPDVAVTATDLDWVLITGSKPVT